MAARKGFLDLPAELRNVVYEHVVRDIDLQHHDHEHYTGFEGQACTKKPGALIDRWNKTSHSRFFNNEIFRSASATIAANRQIHSEFYSVLDNYCIEDADKVTFHVVDLNFQPLMNWFTSLPDAQKRRFQNKDDVIFSENINGRSLNVALDFQHFTPIGDTSLKEWLLFAKEFNIDLFHYCLVILHPLCKAWIGHVPTYPEWLKAYRAFVRSSAAPMAACYQDVVGADSNRNSYPWRCHLTNIRTVLQGHLRGWEQMEEMWWSPGEEDSDNEYSSTSEDPNGFEDGDTMEISDA